MLKKGVSSSSLASSGIDPIKDSSVMSTISYLTGDIPRLYVTELQSQIRRFRVSMKYAVKVRAQLQKTENGSVGLENPYSSTIGALDATGHPQKRQKLSSDESSGLESPVSGSLQPTQKLTLQETRLTAQLARLETLVKTSHSEQIEILGKIDRISEERLLKDARYNKMIASVCGENFEEMDEILSKIAEHYEY